MGSLSAGLVEGVSRQRGVCLCLLLLAGEPLLVAGRILRDANCFPTSNIPFIAASVSFWHEERSYRVVYSRSGASSAVLPPLWHPCTGDGRGGNEGWEGESLASRGGRKAAGERNLHPGKAAGTPFPGSVLGALDKPSTH